MTTWASNGSLSDVQSKIAGASPGDIVTMPAGSFTWNGGVSFIIPLSLIGNGQGSTNITIANTYSGYVFTLSQPSRVSALTLTYATGCTASWAYIYPAAEGFRFDHITYTEISTTPRSMDVIGAWGLVDHCTIAGGPSCELFWITDTNGAAGLNANGNSSWQYAAPYGTNQAVYVENNTFTAGFALSDVGYGGKMVFRFNTISYPMKLDMHDSYNCPGNGNGIGNGGRMIESYCNAWNAMDYVDAMFIRGGTGMLFNNTSASTDTDHNWAEFRDYHVTNHASQLPYKTPLDYPIIGQVGYGIYPSGPLEPMYYFGNLYNAGAGKWPYFVTVPMGGATFVTNSAGYAIGATSITISGGTQTAGVYNQDPDGFVLYAGVDYVAFAGDNTRYLLASDYTSGVSGVIHLASPGLTKAIPASATGVTIGVIVNYQGRTANPAATFASTDIIKPDRDVFSDIFGSGGVHIGTKAQMLASSPTVVGQGWWVTDEGSWNSENATPGAPGYQKGQGQLYKWIGSSWVLFYTPYAYPNPLVNGPSLANTAGMPRSSLQLAA